MPAVTSYFRLLYQWKECCENKVRENESCWITATTALTYCPCSITQRWHEKTIPESHSSIHLERKMWTKSSNRVEIVPSLSNLANSLAS